MIMFRSTGGLGNQIFQYAVARHLAFRVGTEVVVDSGWHRGVHSGMTPRSFELFRYRVKLREATPIEALWIRTVGGSMVGRLPVPRPWFLCREKGFSFDPAVLDFKNFTVMAGLWQSDRYFRDIRDVLMEELQLREALPSKDVSLGEQARGCDSVSIHVRRGDYEASKELSRVHGLCSPGYYQEAFSIIARAVRSPVAFVFADDADWARENIRLDAPTHFVAHNGTSNAHRDLWLMTQCRHNVIANSTFSWWGAWLGSPRDRIVVAPKRWFADGPPSPDIIPGGWIAV
jgi:hypothetical protein